MSVLSTHLLQLYFRTKMFQLWSRVTVHNTKITEGEHGKQRTSEKQTEADGDRRTETDGDRQNTIKSSSLKETSMWTRSPPSQKQLIT